jgi:hypothetical protein
LADHCVPFAERSTSLRTLDARSLSRRRRGDSVVFDRANTHVVAIRQSVSRAQCPCSPRDESQDQSPRRRTASASTLGVRQLESMSEPSHHSSAAQPPRAPARARIKGGTTAIAR